jgi:hypothetical protein
VECLLLLSFPALRRLAGLRLGNQTDLQYDVAGITKAGEMLSEASDLTSENIEKAWKLLGPFGVLPFGDAEQHNPIDVNLADGWTLGLMPEIVRIFLYAFVTDKAHYCGHFCTV